MTKEAREGHTRSLTKAVTWRVTGTVDTFILSLIITGSMKFAGSIAGTEVITKIFLYYFHERAWSYVPWGRGAKPEGDIAASGPSPTAP